MKTLWTLCLLALTGLLPAADLSPTAAAATAPSAATEPASPAEPAAAAQPEAPAMLPPALPDLPAEVLAPEGATPSAEALSGSAEVLVPQDMQDGLVLGSEAPVLELRSLSSTALLKMVQGLDKDAQSLSFDVDLGEVLAPGAETPTARSVDVAALYAELAKRLAYDDDKTAKEAFSLIELRGDARGAEAKALAFADKLADSLVAQAEKGSTKAKAQLKALAEGGNHRARQYLGLEPMPGPPLPMAMTSSAQVEAIASALTPSVAAVAEPLSPSAASVAEPLSPTPKALEP